MKAAADVLDSDQASKLLVAKIEQFRPIYEWAKTESPENNEKFLNDGSVKYAKELASALQAATVQPAACGSENIKTATEWFAVATSATSRLMVVQVCGLNTALHDAPQTVPAQLEQITSFVPLLLRLHHQIFPGGLAGATELATLGTTTIALLRVFGTFLGKPSTSSAKLVLQHMNDHHDAVSQLHQMESVEVIPALETFPVLRNFLTACEDLGLERQLDESILTVVNGDPKAHKVLLAGNLQKSLSLMSKAYLQAGHCIERLPATFDGEQDASEFQILQSIGSWSPQGFALSSIVF